jgi:hypothetical protein
MNVRMQYAAQLLRVLFVVRFSACARLVCHARHAAIMSGDENSEQLIAR